ncbi:helix-turn-helix transcriptional regulator [Pseudorhodoferax sp. Leaf274]|uniref:helix-turn-helix domain-containing protein n=1 Tax=Pseudorhodoferax sp. Leaf274 TaxID=1736318 RepID=UPI0012E1FE9F|nr:helix-turn-helix transcriptional regulator [Pseudorhodoferax sp. Leaf274]
MKKPLDAAVREQLEAQKGSWQAIADDAGVSYSWISKFVNNRIPNPGFKTLTQLQAHLSKRRPTATEGA